MIIMVVEPMAVASQSTGGVSGPNAMHKYNSLVADHDLCLRSSPVRTVGDGCPNTPQPNSLQATTLNWYCMVGRISSVTL